MTVLVTGGAGCIGSRMAHALLDAGEQVVVFDNLTTGFDWAVPSGARLIVGDVGDQLRVGALIAAHRIDAIIHFAASIVVPDSVRDPLGCYRNNTVNSRALIEAVVKAGVRYFIFSSTAAHRRTQDVGREKILSRQSAGHVRRSVTDRDAVFPNTGHAPDTRAAQPALSRNSTPAPNK